MPRDRRRRSLWMKRRRCGAFLEGDVSEREPSRGVELGRVGGEHLRAAGVHDVPQRHIGMPCREAHRGRASHHQRRVERLGGAQAKFLLHFARGRGSRMFARLDMTTSRQPQARILVIDEQDVFRIDHRAVGHEMLGWCGRFGHAVEVRARVEPGKRVGEVRLLESIERRNGRELRADRCSHGPHRSYPWSRRPTAAKNSATLASASTIVSTANSGNRFDMSQLAQRQVV